MYVRIDGQPYVRYPIEPRVNQVVKLPGGLRQTKEVVIDPASGELIIRTEPWHESKAETNKSGQRGPGKGQQVPEVRTHQVQRGVD